LRLAPHFAPGGGAKSSRWQKARRGLRASAPEYACIFKRLYVETLDVTPGEVSRDEDQTIWRVRLHLNHLFQGRPLDAGLFAAKLLQPRQGLE
jgi:hypothetical protein